MKIRLGLAVVMVLTATGAAISQEPEVGPEEVVPWRILLGQQLKQEKACDLNEILVFDESRKGDDVVIEGKVSCVDGRQFDFSRPRQHQKFEIKLCEPAVC
jgi:hypothetical protein